MGRTNATHLCWQSIGVYNGAFDIRNVLIVLKRLLYYQYIRWSNIAVENSYVPAVRVQRARKGWQFEGDRSA
jgi:hypothetical protein